MSPDSKPALSAPTGSKNDPSRARTGTGNSGRPLFPKSHLPVSVCYLLLEKLSKSLIPLSDCPFVLNRLPVFLGKYPCFPGKTGKWWAPVDGFMGSWVLLDVKPGILGGRFSHALALECQPVEGGPRRRVGVRPGPTPYPA